MTTPQRLTPRTSGCPPLPPADAGRGASNSVLSRDRRGCGFECSPRASGREVMGHPRPSRVHPRHALRRSRTGSPGDGHPGATRPFQPLVTPVPVRQVAGWKGRAGCHGLRPRGAGGQDAPLSSPAPHILDPPHDDATAMPAQDWKLLLWQILSALNCSGGPTCMRRAPRTTRSGLPFDRQTPRSVRQRLLRRPTRCGDPGMGRAAEMLPTRHRVIVHRRRFRPRRWRAC